MSEDKIVWSDDGGDLRRKSKDQFNKDEKSAVIESEVLLYLRRLTSGKGRTIIEISGLPKNKSWCKKMAKDLKKSIGVGGSYKNDMIEVHGEKIEQVKLFFHKRSIKTKQTGG